MDSKLTLNVDKTLTEKAKLYARSQGRSLSDLVENYFRLITTDQNSSEIQLSSRIRSLKGSIKLPSDFNYKEELRERISKKYQK